MSGFVAINFLCAAHSPSSPHSSLIPPPKEESRLLDSGISQRISCTFEHSLTSLGSYCMASPHRRMSQRPQLPPISRLQAIADHRVAPEPFDPPSPQPNAREPRIGSSSSGPQSGRLPHRHFRSPNSTQSTRNEPRFWTVSTAIHHNASSFWNAWGKSSSASPPSSRGRPPRPQHSCDGSSREAPYHSAFLHRRSRDGECRR
ncbi:hypothetical protein EDB84DRAFT_1502767 [Lactarius hengduanensis]|nr:hypothetical protein EDB84DRAFT_1502767 [Lactarius hengduanensis]